MLTFFFNRHSPVVYALTFFSLWVAVRFFAIAFLHPLSLGAIAYVAASAVYAFLILCRLIPWYKRPHRGHGVEDHFAKAFVIGAYSYGLAAILVFFTHADTVPWILACLPLLFIARANVWMMIHHMNDTSSVPPSYHSRSLYDAI